MIIKQIKDITRKVSGYIKSCNNNSSFTPAYRVIEIIKEENDEYMVKIQVINKNIIFDSKPEKLLSEDSVVDLFSPRDIRTLTYLGYLGINAPKYKILAQRLMDNDNRVAFSIRKKGEKQVITKTAAEILQEKEILDSISSEDAQKIGYAFASESTVSEEAQKQEALKQLQQNPA
jgi:hypothetical protein